MLTLTVSHTKVKFLSLSLLPVRLLPPQELTHSPFNGSLPEATLRATVLPGTCGAQEPLTAVLSWSHCLNGTVVRESWNYTSSWCRSMEGRASVQRPHQWAFSLERQ